MTERKTAKRKILRIAVLVLVILIMLSVSMLIVTKFVYDSLFPRYERSDFERAVNINYSDISNSYPRERLSFKSGEHLLAAYVYGGDNQKGLIVVSPGLSDGAEDYTSIIMRFVDLGWKVFAFDTTGSFESEGENSVGFAQAAIDLDNALKFIETRKDLKNLNLCLFGHSRGGYASALMPAFGHDISAIATVGAVNSPMEITIESAHRRIGALAYTNYPALYAYQSMIFSPELINLTAADALDQGNTPALIIHCENDETVDINGSSVYAHKDEVENPNARFMLYTDSTNSGHTSLLFTADANLYRRQIEEDYQSLTESFDGNIPKEIENQFLDNIDSMKAQQANTKLVDMISDYFQSNFK